MGGAGPWAMGILLILLAVILIGVFAGAWLRDRGRSNTQATDPERPGVGPRE